jgi:multidrug efflux pump subunit AcrB
MLGMLALVGILVNDALVLVAAYNSNLREGMELRKALYEACLSRFRPILLTSLTTVAGLAPLMFNKSYQAQFLIPMAISLACGLAFVTLITLVLLPVFLIWVNPLHRTWVWIVTGKWPEVEAGEPTLRELREMNELEHHG